MGAHGWVNIDFAPVLEGSATEAYAAKQQITKYFKDYDDSDRQDAKKLQLTLASKILSSISKCNKEQIDIYCEIVTEVFSHNLQPEASVKYWSLYTNYIRYLHYVLVEKKDFEKAALVYKHISSYKNKLQNAENGLAYVNISCYHLFLQNFLKSIDLEAATKNATEVVENLTHIFRKLLETNNQMDCEYPDILKKTINWLFPRNNIGTVYQLIKSIPTKKVKQMFESLFTLYGKQKLENNSESEEQALFVIEAVYTFLQLDIMDKMQLQLGVMLLSYCRTESRLQAVKPISEILLVVYDYIKLLCAQNPTIDFQNIYSKHCESLVELFNNYSKIVSTQPWFGNLLVLLFYIHSQLQNNLIFSCFWRQMLKPHCYKSMFKLFMELMKLAPCISADTKLYTAKCCTSPRKHVILSFAQVALTGFVLYCQNVSVQDEEEISNQDGNSTNYYTETIQTNVVMIINHAFKIIDKMDCITSNSQEIEIILTRFKQATLNCKTSRQAGTCITILERFLKIKTKIPSKEWPLLLRRLYKTANQLLTEQPLVGREIHMCYIASMLHESITEVDIGQIRTQISIFYTSSTVANDQSEQLPQEMCLLQSYHTTTSLFKPHLEPQRKKLLHWLESQHILKYLKANTTLLHSLLKSSQSYYDFVIVTKLGKLQTYAIAKISSLYKSLKAKASELGSLNRIDLLIFGHVCVMLLNESNSNQKFQIDSKDLSEEQLEKLLDREEMETFTINNDKKRLNLVWEAFEAFKGFYEKFDSEIISMNEAIIDWESFLDDVAGLALCLQLSGFMDKCSQIWLFHYKCSRLLQDNYSSLRGLAFFCEYSEHFTGNVPFKLDEEINSHFPFIIHCLEKLPNLPRQTYQNYVLLVLIQLAYYYTRLLRYSFAQILLQYVALKHEELPERQGRYDIIMATMDTIKFRLLWQNFHASEQKAVRTSAENVLLNRCLLRDIEETLDRLHDFSYISSNDGVLFSILILGLVQELAECTANRLCDNFINSLFIATCKSSLMLGLPLRLVQILSMWMRLNLQMECIDKAQTKLKIIEYVLGIKSLQELRENSAKNSIHIQSSTLLPTACADLASANSNPGVEAIRKLAQVQLSPIKSEKLQLSPSHRNYSLNNYLKYVTDNNQIEQLDWMFFIVGCLNARLYFLVEDYDQLEAFYEKGNKWLEMRQNEFNKKYFRNVQLMALQHYVNFLRARRKYDKAQQYLLIAIELCENMKYKVDGVYHINFQLQLLNTRKEFDNMQNMICQRPVHNRLRRQLQFNISPENNELTASSKKPIAIKSSVLVTASSRCASEKKSKIEFDKFKPKPPKFEICEDAKESIDITEDESKTVVNMDTEATNRLKALEHSESYKTPKVARTTTRSVKTTITKSTNRLKKPQFINIDLTDSSESSTSITPTLSSSLENLETKENLNTNELIAQMQNLEIKSHKRPTRTTTETKTKCVRAPKTPRTKKPSPPVIVLQDSSLETPTQIPRTRGGRDKSPIDRSLDSNGLLLSSSTRPRRQRKINPGLNIEENLCFTSATPVSSSKSSRKRQKNVL